MLPRFVSIDLETSGLDPERHDILEVGLVAETSTDLEIVEFSLPMERPKNASIEALEINGYGTREFAPLWEIPTAIRYLDGVLGGAHIVGKNPSFDAGFLWALLRRDPLIGQPPWHHRLVDVGSLAWGYHCSEVESAPWMFDGHQVYQSYPPNSERVAELMRIPIPEGARHSALGDARWVYGVFRAIVPR